MGLNELSQDEIHADKKLTGTAPESFGLSDCLSEAEQPVVCGIILGTVAALEN